MLRLNSLAVVLIIMLLVIACKTQPFSTPYLHYLDMPVKKENTEEYYEERNKLFKERYEQKYGSVNENITNNEGVKPDNKKEANVINSTENQPYQSKLDTETK